MKLPTYITREQKKEINKLIYHVRHHEGIKQALLLKKMATVAAYGTMINGKIHFDTFIESLKNNLITRENSMDAFWHIKERSKTTENKMFLIPFQTVYKGTQHDVEMQIQTLYATINIQKIKYEYRKEFKQMFNKI